MNGEAPKFVNFAVAPVRAERRQGQRHFVFGNKPPPGRSQTISARVRCDACKSSFPFSLLVALHDGTAPEVRLSYRPRVTSRHKGKKEMESARSTKVGGIALSKKRDEAKEDEKEKEREKK